MKRAVIRHLAAVVFAICIAQTATAEPLVLESTIALPNTSGRIDHLSIDLNRKRLFVAEIGNGSVDVVDIAGRKVVHRIANLDEPQGVVYAPKGDVIAVACGGDGTVRIFSASDFKLSAVIRLGDDADNIHLDPRNGHIVVGYGEGRLAILDAAAAKLRDVGLPAHPEGFAVSKSGIAYVNLPDAEQIDVVDLDSGKLLGTWRTPHLSSNFPLAVDAKSHVATVFRAPPTLAVIDSNFGRIMATADTCGDADDVFFDERRSRIYVSCGAGAVESFAWKANGLAPPGRTSTAWGAGTSLFVPELDRLFVAARSGLLGSNAAIRVYRPSP
jgi:DNA-binding beta-propeller fold protein YncE